MASYTTNYGLHQWEPADDFLRTDFNTDFAKIDAGMRAAQSAADGAQSAASTAQSTADGKSGIVTGSYTGNDAESRTISLGFQPKAVLVERRDGVRYSNATVAGLALAGKPAYTSSGDGGVTVTSNGFTVSRKNFTTTNESGITFYYLAVR